MLIEKILGNTQLKFVEARTGVAYGIGDLDLSLFDNDKERQLFFLYTDHGIDTITLLLSALRSVHVVAMLPGEMNPVFKEQLELLYRPAIIFDSRRSALAGFDRDGLLWRGRNPEATTRLAPQLKLLLSTSGTTGSPKFVKLSAENLWANARAIAAYLPIESSDCTPLNLPLHYSYGLSVFTTNAINGGKVVFGMADLMSKEFWNQFEQYGCTSLAGVPYVYEVLSRTGFLKKRFSALRYLTQAGGKLSEVLTRSFLDYSLQSGLDFFVMYGQTEATARMSYLHLNEHIGKMGSIGKPIDGGSFSIASDTGELLYSGPNVFGGYACSAADLAEYDQPARLATGDLARVDEEGFYFITGRMKRVVKLFGSRVNLDEIEQLLNNKFTDYAFACVSKDDRLLVVFCTPQNAGSDVLTQLAVQQYLFAQTSIHGSVVRLRLMDTLPANTNGKTDYQQLNILSNEL